MKGLLCIQYSNLDTSSLIISQKSQSDEQSLISARISALTAPNPTISNLVLKITKLYSNNVWGKLFLNQKIEGMGPVCQYNDVTLREIILGTPCTLYFVT